MSRVGSYDLATAPAESRPILERVIAASPGVGILDIWAAMAESPVTIDAYMAIRESIEAHSTFDPRLRSAMALAAGSAAGGTYSASINRRIAVRSGWSAEEVEALRTATVDDPKLQALLALVQAAAANFGAVPDGTWAGAIRSGWTARELVEAFAIVALTQFVDGFATFAQVEADRGRQG